MPKCELSLPHQELIFLFVQGLLYNIFATAEITQITSLSTPYGVSFRRGFAAKNARKMANSQCFGVFTPENKSQSFQTQVPSLPQQFWFLSRKRRFQLIDILWKQHLIKTEGVWVLSSKLASGVCLGSALKHFRLNPSLHLNFLFQFLLQVPTSSKWPCNQYFFLVSIQEGTVKKWMVI